VVGEVSLVETVIGSVGPQEDDIQRLDPVAAEFAFGFLDVGRRDLFSGSLWLRSSTTPSP